MPELPWDGLNCVPDPTRVDSVPRVAVFPTCGSLRYSPPNVVLRPRSLRTLALLCLLLQLSGVALAFEKVLCVAPDGHVALEVAHAGLCETETRRHHAAAHDSGVGTPCGDHPCTDIALGQTAWRAIPRGGDGDPAAPSLITVLPSIAAATVVLPPPPRAGAAPWSESRLRARRTIVLRN